MDSKTVRLADRFRYSLVLRFRLATYHTGQNRDGRYVRAAIRVQPYNDLVKPTAQAFRRDCDPDSDRKPAFGVASGLLTAEGGRLAQSAKLRGSHDTARL
jgi:hypothetical protein